MIRGPIALVTCREALGLDTDMPLLVAALDRLDIENTVVPWDDDVEWSAFGFVVLRSTWDYHRRYDEFMTWVHKVSAQTRMANSADIITWNTDKRYLADLAAEGLPVVSTMFVARGEGVDHAVVEALLAQGDVVVKPTISAGSNDTERHHNIDHVIRHVEVLHATNRTAMVQPYLADVETSFETGLVYIDGEFSHAFSKGPMLRDPKIMAEGLYAEERIAARTASAAERSLGDRVLTTLAARFGRPLYTRVDLLPAADGPVIIEVEMTEPSLYVHLGDDAADRLATAIARISA